MAHHPEGMGADSGGITGARNDVTRLEARRGLFDDLNPEARGIIYFAARSAWLKVSFMTSLLIAKTVPASGAGGHGSGRIFLAPARTPQYQGGTP